MNSTFKKTSSTNESHLRDEVFYLLKKWSSLTHLRMATSLYRDFILEYEKNLNTPSADQAWLEDIYRSCFLPYLVILESGLKLLNSDQCRRGAYQTIGEGIEFTQYLWGRGADCWGIEGDPFFINLGMGGRREQGQTIIEVDHKSFVRGCLKAVWAIRTMNCTVNLDFSEFLKSAAGKPGRSKVFEHWTFETFFASNCNCEGWADTWPPCREIEHQIDFCPAKSDTPVGQIFSGESVVMDGIYEPWFPDGRVGCPNYLLAGSVAHEYVLEGTEKLLEVRWRPLWEDARYRNGSVPAEEFYYRPPKPPDDPRPMGVYADSKCPKTGRWQAFRLKNRIEFVREGDKMPGPIRTSTGLVYWQLLEDGIV